MRFRMAFCTLNVFLCSLPSSNLHPQKLMCGFGMKLTSTMRAESSSSQLTVVIVAPQQPSPSTFSEDDPQSNAELGLMSPMLSPRAASSASGVLQCCCIGICFL